MKSWSEEWQNLPSPYEDAFHLAPNSDKQKNGHKFLRLFLDDYANKIEKESEANSLDIIENDKIDWVRKMEYRKIEAMDRKILGLKELICHVLIIMYSVYMLENRQHASGPCSDVLYIQYPIGDEFKGEI
ncbi:hypothetical protein RND71_008213 [Anisodus tanguticus]|uniref:Uncharacterized protein n=1 Tax=Anisodus tanguticus TaxID=243964 RepID=A0AAE1SN97_9SOLA|nr:hypothetical protein RND71_008213 [Anisodus tanguticus]